MVPHLPMDKPSKDTQRLTTVGVTFRRMVMNVADGGAKENSCIASQENELGQNERWFQGFDLKYFDGSYYI